MSRHREAKSTRGPHSLLLLMVVVAWAGMVARNYAIEHPTVFGDEYLYQALTRHALDDVGALEGRGTVSIAYPSFLFFRTYHLLTACRCSLFRSAQVLNALFFCLAALPIFGVARLLVSPRLALLVVACALVAPYGAHTAYFLPEAMYYLVFWVCVWAFVRLVGERLRTAAVVTGALLGLLALVKVHGILILAAVNLTLLLLGLMRRRLRLPGRDLTVSIALLDGAFLLSMLPLRYLLSGQTFTLFGRTYDDIAQQAATWPLSMHAISTLTLVAARHLSFLALLLGVPILVTALGLTGGEWDGSRRVRAVGLSLLAFASLAIIVVVTVRYQLMLGQEDPRQLWRVHGRYYNFLAPLFLIGYCASFDRLRLLVHQRRARLFSWACGLTGAWLILGWRPVMGERRLPVVDYPEVAGLSRLPAGVFFSLVLLVAAVLLTFALSRRPRMLLFLVPYVGLSVAGNVADLGIQLQDSRANNEQAQTVARVEELLSGASLDSGVIVAPNADTAWPFLAEFHGSPWVRFVRPGTVVTAREIPPGAPWMVLLDRYRLGVAHAGSMAVGRMRVVSLGAIPLAAETDLATIAGTGDGFLEPGHTTSAAITQLYVAVSGPGADASRAPGAAGGGDRFLLVAGGAHGGPATTSCRSGVQPADLRMRVDATFDAVLHVARLRVNGGVPLPANRYRLLVCGGGSPGAETDAAHGRDDRLVDFVVVATNLLRNPNFDDNLESWEWSAPPSGEVTHDPDDVGGAPTSGSARFADRSAGQTLELSQCVTLSGQRRYEVGGLVMVEGEPGGSPPGAPQRDQRGGAYVRLDYFAGQGCTGSDLGHAASPTSASGIGGSWGAFNGVLEAPRSALSARMRAIVDFGPTPPFVLRLDSVYVIDDVVAADGFEPGSTSEWSVTMR